MDRVWMVQGCLAGCHGQRSWHLPGLMEVQSSGLGWILFMFLLLLVKNTARVVHGGRYCSEPQSLPRTSAMGEQGFSSLHFDWCASTLLVGGECGCVFI